MAVRFLPLMLMASSAQAFAFAPAALARPLPFTTAAHASLARPAVVTGSVLSRSASRTARRGASPPLTMMAGIGSLMSEPTPPSEKVLKAVETAGGRVTVADVASGAGVSLSEAKAQLTVLALLAKGDLEVSSDGELVYRFGSSFRAELSARSTKKQIQEAYDKVAPIGFYLLRVSFGELPDRLFKHNTPHAKVGDAVVLLPASFSRVAMVCAAQFPPHLWSV